MKQHSMFKKIAFSIFLVSMLCFFITLNTALFISYSIFSNFNFFSTEFLYGYFQYVYKLFAHIFAFTVLITAISFTLSKYFSKKIVKPINEMEASIENIHQHIPYAELFPFIHAIYSDRLLRENNEKIREEFTANVSHELKSPLTSISGYAELIELGFAQPEDVTIFAKKIRTQSTRMLTLVEDILQISRLDTQRQSKNKPIFEPIDLYEMAKECSERQYMNARLEYVTISVIGEQTIIKANRKMLEELFDNLTTNAIRYNKPGGKVFLIVCLNAENLPTLIVKDTGIGIPKDSLTRIFERFYCVDKSRSKDTGGTGLGLAIVKHVVLVHDAKIEVKSKVSKGTSFTVTF